MKKHKHPKQNLSTIIFTDGSSIAFHWLYHKVILKLANDSLTHNLWKNQKINNLLSKRRAK
jgi:hypothetical protein